MGLRISLGRGRGGISLGLLPPGCWGWRPGRQGGGSGSVPLAQRLLSVPGDQAKMRLWPLHLLPQ